MIVVTGSGPLHRLHPLTKLTGIAFVVAGALWGPGRWLPALLFLTLIPVAVLSGIGKPWLQRVVRLLLPLAAMLFLIHGFFHPDGTTALVQAGQFPVYQEGILFAALLSSRLAAIVGATLLLLLTTEPGQLLTALMARGLPPALAYIISSTLYILPLMRTKAVAILQAQQARGLETEGNLWRRSKALLPLLGPLVLGALAESEERAIALEARAFRVHGPKTILQELPDSAGQQLARSSGLLVIITLLGWRLWNIFA